jgi:uncharacterized protein
MGISLYDAIVPNYLQVLGSLRGVLIKGQEYAAAAALPLETLAEARLVEDMFPLRLQVQRVADHSAGALRDARQGAFSMPRLDTGDYAALRQLIVDTEASLASCTRDEVNALEGRAVIFDTGSHKTTFTAEAFLLSFSLPNFYFHATTAYDILRMKGVPIGKRDYLGQLRTKLG